MREYFEDDSIENVQMNCGCKTCKEAVEVDTVDDWEQIQTRMPNSNDRQNRDQVETVPQMQNQNKRRNSSAMWGMEEDARLKESNYLSGSDSMITNGSMAAGGQECNDCVIQMVGLSQAYVPMQSTMNLMTPETSLCNGTAFRELVNHYRKGTGLKS